MPRVFAAIALAYCLVTGGAVSQVLPPSAPVATAATVIRDTSFSANWNASTGATSYVLDVASDTIFRLVVPGYNNINVGNLLTHPVTGLAPSTKYFYRLRASNAGGTSAASNVIVVTTVPPAPVAFAASKIGQTFFTANWDTSTGATSYFLDVATDTAFVSIVPGYNDLNTGNVQQQNVAGLAPGTRYYYRVRAGNAGGPSLSSAFITVTTVVATPPPPVASAATIVTQTSFSANWNPAAGATTYFLDVATDTNFTAIISADSNLNVGNVLTRSIAGLAPGTKYFYRVRGSNVGGTSGNSNVIVVTTVVATPPAPVAMIASNVVQTSFTANWNASPGATTYLLDVASDTNFTAFVPGYNNLNVGNVLSRNVTGLSASTKYFYRVRGSNVGGTSGSSGVIVVTTLVPVPPAPVATPASNIGTNSFTANWNAASGATSYRLDVGLDTAFAAVLSAYNNVNVGNVLTEIVSGLAPGTRYYYRVRGSNAGGTSGNSGTVSVTTAGIPPPPPVLTAPASGSTGQPAALTLAWISSPGATSYDVQVATASTFASPFIDDSSVSATSRPLSGLALNTTYFWRVAGRNQYGTGAFSSPAFSFSTVDTAAVTGTIPFPANPAESDYRMVSLPGLVPGPVSGLTAGSGGVPKFDWRAFRIPASGVFTELGPQDQIGVGEGIWLIRKYPLSANKSGAMPAVQSNGAFPITIHSGWNIIADPFNVPVRWAAVRTLNDLLPSDVIQGWAGSYAVDSVMEPLKGYYYYSNSTAATTLAIPYPFPSMQPPPPYVAPPASWSLQVAFESADNNDADCHLGVSPAAVPGHDSLEIRKPPLAFAGGEVYFSRPESGGKYARFSTDYRPAINGSEEWDVQVSHPNGCNGTLRFSGMDEIPPAYSVMLIAPDNGWPINLRVQKEYHVQSALTDITVRVLVGPDSVLAHKITGLVPDSYTLNQNYPNPFNPSTTIRYGLPQRSMVSLTVFNALGQRVRQLVNEEQDAGFHEVTFDGAGLASGIYFYRIRAGSFVQTKKLVLLQ